MPWHPMTRRSLLALPAALRLAAPQALPAQPTEFRVKPKIRAITGFLSLNPGSFEAQIRDTAARLRDAKLLFENAGYEVEDIRVATQPFSNYAETLSVLQRIEQTAEREKISPAIGPAVTTDGGGQPELVVEALKKMRTLQSSVVVADRNGVHWPNVKKAARIVARLRDESPGGYGNFNFAAIAMLPPHGPFFPGAWHDGGAPRVAIAWEAAGVVAEALQGTQGEPLSAEARLELALKPHALEIERLGRAAATACRMLYAGIDVSPAPLKNVSIGQAMENHLGAPVGSSGTMAIAATITRVLQSLPVTRTGYSGLMIPIMEDTVLAKRWGEGRLTLDSLLAYSAVCGTGLDTVPLPGDVSEERLAKIIGDVASLAFRWNKPLTARLMPVKGLKAGDMTKFEDPFLVNTRLQPL